MMLTRIQIKKVLRYLFGGVLLSFFYSVSFSCLANSKGEYQQQSASTSKKLAAVQAEISKQKVAINNVNQQRQNIELQLKNDDLAIAASIKKINNTQTELSNARQQIKQLTKQQKTLLQQKQQQQHALAKQLRAAYSTGSHDYLKLMLNQEQASSIQRTVTYYQYINQARMKEIDQFQATITELQQVSASLAVQAKKLDQLIQQQKQQQQVFEGRKNQRENTVRALKKELLTQQQQLAKLSAEEENLVIALQKLAELARAIPQSLKLEGLTQLKNKLSWPVKAKIKHRFGTRKKGYLKWKGVILAAPQGREVKAIYNGTILFSNWLKGYGLVTVIDHGQGYMSLYGHNQALLRNVGEQVETGEPIALVGQSGGQESPGLYFEIRHRGKAMNPKSWCR